MTSIKDGILSVDKMVERAQGGTELLTDRLLRYVGVDHLKGFQIHISRVTDEMDPNLIQIYWAHDLPSDPAADDALAEGRWQRFKHGVFVSHWQRQAFHDYYNIPYSWSGVIENAIVPLELSAPREDDKLKLIYTSTPHRGLGLLYQVFDVLSKNYTNLELDVYSSFNIYGWPERDKQFEPLYNQLREHPMINYHGFQPNDVVRKALQQSDIWVLPSVWKETSCLALIEAMSAGLACVHSSLAALPETSKGLTWMYRYTDDPQDHLNELYRTLAKVIELHKSGAQVKGGEFQKMLIDHRHNTNVFAQAWKKVLQ